MLHTDTIRRFAVDYPTYAPLCEVALQQGPDSAAHEAVRQSMLYRYYCALAGSGSAPAVSDPLEGLAFALVSLLAGGRRDEVVHVVSRLSDEACDELFELTADRGDAGTSDDAQYNALCSELADIALWPCGAHDAQYNALCSELADIAGGDY